MKYKELLMRPLAIFSLCFYALLCVFQSADLHLRLISAAIFTVVLIILIIFRIIGKNDSSKPGKALKRALCFFFAGALFAAGLSAFANDFYIKRFEKYDNQTLYTEGVVSEVEYSKIYASSFVLKTEHIGNEKLSVKVFVEADGPITLGEGVSGYLTFSSLDGTEKGFLSDGIRITARAEKLETHKADFDLQVWAAKINQKLTAEFVTILGERDGGLYAALFLGNQSYLTEDIEHDYWRIGITHLLALSGSHLTVICMIIRRLLRPLGTVGQNIISFGIILFYMFITGLSPSVCRAGIMVMAVFLSSFSRRSPDSFTFLGISTVVISLFDPFSGGDIGLQLSVCAVFAMLIANKRDAFKAPAERDGLTVIKNIGNSILIGLYVLMFTMPLMWLYFGSFSLLSPIATILFSPFVTVVLWTAPVVLLLSPFKRVSSMLSVLINLLCSFFNSLAKALANIENIIVPLIGPICAILCVCLCISFLFFAICKKWKKLISAIVCLSLLGGIILTAEAYKAKTNDCAVIQVHESSSGEAIYMESGKNACIVDIGNGYTGSLYYAANSPIYGICEIDFLLITHVHKSHPTSLKRILNSSSIHKLIIPKDTDKTLSLSLEEICKNREIELSEFEYGDKIIIGDSTLTVPKPLFIKRSVQPLIQVDIESENKVFTYLGGAFNDCKEYQFPKSQVLWLGAHGPKYKNPIDQNLLSEKQQVYCAQNIISFVPNARDNKIIILK